MKVKELIAELQKYDGNLEIWVDNDGRYTEAATVELSKNGYYKDPYDVILIL